MSNIGQIGQIVPFPNSGCPGEGPSLGLSIMAGRDWKPAENLHKALEALEAAVDAYEQASLPEALESDPHGLAELLKAAKATKQSIAAQEYEAAQGLVSPVGSGDDYDASLAEDLAADLAAEEAAANVFATAADVASAGAGDSPF